MFHPHLQLPSKTHDIWEREITDLKVIPTSTRLSPSRALLLFEHLFKKGTPLRILDAGTGTGRNALHMARQGHAVVALDFAQSALAQLRRSAQEAGLEHRISIVSGSLEDVLPFNDASFDLVLDSYVFCHFLESDIKSHYESEVRRVLTPHGQFFSIQFSTDDEYYRELMTDSNAPDPIVVDLRNGVAKQLYSRASAQRLFSALGDLTYFAHLDFTDFVAGRNYRRSVFVLLVEK